MEKKFLNIVIVAYLLAAIYNIGQENITSENYFFGVAFTVAAIVTLLYKGIKFI
jgi:hypothetical protein